LYRLENGVEVGPPPEVDPAIPVRKGRSRAA
jgi:flagellar biosynthesis protein